MAHTCSCHASEAPSSTAPVSARDTVGEVARRVPGALEAMKALGINHCCGAHLTLTEAAAAAGVPLARLLAAIEPAARAS